MIPLSSIPSKTPVTDVRNGLMDRLWQRYLLWVEGAANGLSGNFIGTVIGMVGNPQDTFSYRVFGGDYVVITGPIAGVVGVGNAVNFALDGLPILIRPSMDAWGYVLCADNGVNLLTGWYIAPGSTFIRFDYMAVAGISVVNQPNGWTAAGLRQIGPWNHFMYRLRAP